MAESTIERYIRQSKRTPKQAVADVLGVSGSGSSGGGGGGSNDYPQSRADDEALARAAAEREAARKAAEDAARKAAEQKAASAAAAQRKTAVEQALKVDQKQSTIQQQPIPIKKQEGTIIKRKQVGTFKGKPYYEIVAVENGRERPATEEEAKLIRQKTLVVEEIKKPTGVFEQIQFEQQLATEKRRTQATRKRTIKGEVTSFIGGAAASVTGTIGFGKQIFTKPIQTTKEVVVGVTEVTKNPAGKGKEITRVVEQDPSYALGFVATEAATTKGSQVAVIKTRQVAGFVKARTVEAAKFRPIKEGKITGVPLEKKGTINIGVLEKGEDIGISLSKQSKIAGTKVNAVSAQTGFKTYDVPLERQFFADPFGRLRTSRFQEAKPAKLVDVLAGDVTFRFPGRRQAFLFEQTSVRKLPVDIKRSLQKGESLTFSQQRRLAKLQEGTYGEFAPIGFLSREPEVVTKGIIKKKAVSAVTTKGIKRIEIIRAELVKPTTRTRELLKRKSLSPVEEIELTKRLSKETGFTKSEISSIRSDQKFVSPSASALSKSSRISKLRKLSAFSFTPSKTYLSKLTSVSPNTIRRKPSISVSPSPTSSGTSLSGVSRGASPISINSKATVSPPPATKRIPPTSKPMLRLSLPEKKRQPIKKQPSSYNVYAKPQNKNKFVKVNRKPLSKRDALDAGAYAVDTSLSRTFKIKPSTRKAEAPQLRFPAGYFSDNRNKFRNYRVKRGRKTRVSSTRFIENKKYVGDTPQEIAKLTLSRRIRQLA